MIIAGYILIQAAFDGVYQAAACLVVWIFVF